ncbi:hypothetical protein [Leeuwenhoekiella parthenopeia]|uniref:Uncharacterized protein n=1 Tax=Leeuwenhoekiella parthenopeia TaxID=2890320 RepID=A0ABS8GNR8_9FLAO|nr:hypothetical protein [Leeuwenhoekiella parthenopeia]MCC4211330.1 hypothetical protein [Leeuwenhoekiella parthenopeia]
MNELLEPIACCLATHTINYLEPVLEKYKKLSNLTGASLRDTLSKGKAAILRNRSFHFNQTLTQVEFDEALTIYDIKDQLLKIAEIKLEGETITYTWEHIIVNDNKYCHNRYSQFFEDQDFYIEYICITILSNQLDCEKHISRVDSGKVYISLQNACAANEFTSRQIRDYAKSFGIEIFNNTSTGKGLIEVNDYETLLLQAKACGLEYLL